MIFKLLLVLALLGAEPVPKTKDVKYSTKITIEYGESGNVVTMWFLNSTDGYVLGVNEELFEEYRKGGRTYTSQWWSKDYGF